MKRKNYKELKARNIGLKQEIKHLRKNRRIVDIIPVHKKWHQIILKWLGYETEYI